MPRRSPTRCSPARPLPAAVTAVAVDAPPADPLTVTSDGVWLDLRVTPAGATRARRPDRAPRDRRPAGRRADARHRDGHRDRDRHRHRRPRRPRRPRRRRRPRPRPRPRSRPSSTAAGATSPPASLAVRPPRSGSRSRAASRGYRSVAGPATADAPVRHARDQLARRPGVAADARARDARAPGRLRRSSPATRSRCATASATTARSTTQAIAFSADGTTGFTGGTVAFGAATAAGPRRSPTRRCRRSATRSSSAASSPNGDGRVLAISRQGGGAALHARPRLDVPGHGADARPGARALRAAARGRLAAAEPPRSASAAPARS